MIYNNLVYLFIFLISIFIIYLFGIGTLALIDQKINNINFKLPEQDINLNLKSNDKIIDLLKNNNYTINHSNLINKTEIENFSSDIKGFNSNENINEYMDNNINTLVEINNNNDICFIDHNHNTKCNYGSTNYPDPRNMSPIDKKIFQVKYPSNLTLQDYVNWLLLNKDNKKNLCYEHLKNLEKLIKNKKLIYKPKICPPDSSLLKCENKIETFSNLVNHNLDNAVKDESLDFKKLLEESSVNFSAPLDLLNIDNTINYNFDKIKGYNYVNYNDIGKINRKFKPRKGKTSLQQIKLMTIPQMSR
jgi:hypothetical protein